MRKDAAQRIGGGSVRMGYADVPEPILRQEAGLRVKAAFIRRGRFSALGALQCAEAVQVR